MLLTNQDQGATLIRSVGARSDEAFQLLLLRFSGAAARGASPSALVELFCREAREFFQVSGVYFWRAISPDELVGQEADGVFAAQFRGMRMKASESAVSAEAIRARRTRCATGWRRSLVRDR